MMYFVLQKRLAILMQQYFAHSTTAMYLYTNNATLIHIVVHPETDRFCIIPFLRLLLPSFEY